MSRLTTHTGRRVSRSFRGAHWPPTAGKINPAANFCRRPPAAAEYEQRNGRRTTRSCQHLRRQRHVQARHVGRRTRVRVAAAGRRGGPGGRYSGVDIDPAAACGVRGRRLVVTRHDKRLVQQLAVAAGLKRFAEAAQYLQPTAENRADMAGQHDSCPRVQSTRATASLPPGQPRYSP